MARSISERQTNYLSHKSDAFWRSEKRDEGLFVRFGLADGYATTDWLHACEEWGKLVFTPGAAASENGWILLQCELCAY